MFGAKLDSNGFGFDHNSQKVNENNIRIKELKMSENVQEILNKIRLLESYKCIFY